MTVVVPCLSLSPVSSLFTHSYISLLFVIGESSYLMITSIWLGASPLMFHILTHPHTQLE